MGTVLFAGASETATLTVTFNVTTNGVATPTDPTTVTLVVTDPLGAASTYTYPASITKTSTGNYWANVSTPTAGVWQYVWTGTGTVPDVQAGTFTVQEVNLGHLYATPEQVKSRIGIRSTDTSSDLELQQACYAASRHVENLCQRRFWRATETRVFAAASGALYSLQLGPWNDLISAASVATDYDGDGVFETAWGAGSWELAPVRTSGPEQRPYTELRVVSSNVYLPSLTVPAYSRQARVQITGLWGWPAVPAAVTEATRILAASLFKAKDAPFGVAAFGDLGVIRVRQDPMVDMLLGPYRHPDAWVA